MAYSVPGTLASHPDPLTAHPGGIGLLTGTRWQFRWKDAQLDQQQSMVNPQRIVDSQHADRRSTNSRQSLQHSFVPCEMVRPSLSSWIEKRVQDIRLGIVTRRIRTFKETARGAAQSEVFDDRWSIMFLRPDMVKMKRTRIVILRKLTVFASAVRSFPNLLTSRRRHI